MYRARGRSGRFTIGQARSVSERVGVSEECALTCVKMMIVRIIRECSLLVDKMHVRER
jgi:hypothetical protein